MQPHAYIYLDKEGIKSLFAQTVDRLETELRKSTETDVTEKAGAKFGLGKAIASLLGIEIGAKVEKSKASKLLEEAKLTLTVEHKLIRLQQHLSEEGSLSRTIDDAVNRSAQMNKPVFIDLHESFDTPQFLKAGGADRATQDGAIMFEIADRFAARVVMAASLPKFPSASGGKLNRLSHLAIHFQGHKGKSVSLHVFGYARSLSSSTCQIKPYAIWL